MAETAAYASPEPLIGAVVIARNEERTIQACLAAARDGLAAVGGGDLLMVDSASTDRTVPLALEAGCRVYAIRQASRRSPSAGRRIGESLTRSRYLLFLDGDCCLDPGFLPAALRAMEEDERLGVVAGRRRDFYRTRKGILAASRDYYRDDGPAGRDEPRYGGSALYRRSALRAAGSFHPFLRSQEEADLSHRLQALGFRAAVLPVPMIRHITVPRESLRRLLRTTRHGFYLGRGQAIRVFLGRGRVRAAFQDLSRVFATLILIALGAASLGAWLSSGVFWPLAGWLGLCVAGFAGLALRGRSLHHAAYYAMEWVIQGLFVIPGFLAPVPSPDTFRWKGDELKAEPAAAASLPRVLLVGPRPDPPHRGGVERGVDLLLRTDLARRTSMRVFDNYRRRDPTRPLWRRLAYQAGKLQAFWIDIRSRPVDLVHVKTSSGINFHQNALYAWAARMAGLPVVLQIHCGKFSAFYDASPPLLRAWIRRTLASATEVIALSRDLEARLKGIAPGIASGVVPNGLAKQETAELDPGTDSRRPQILFVGTGERDLNREKGLVDLLAVLPDLASRHPGARWVLAGLPDGDEILGSLAGAQGEISGSPRIRCLGFVDGDEKRMILRSSTVLVLPSYFENMPNVLLEAMAAGMAVVASRVGAIPEMLGRGEGGILFDPGDRTALRDALDRLLLDTSRAQEQGRWNRRRVLSQHSMTAVEDALEPVYRRAAGWMMPERTRAAEDTESDGRVGRTGQAPSVQQALRS